jgi:hypothetical protein
MPCPHNLAYLEKPSNDTLLSFLALPKVGLPPKSLGKNDNPVERLTNYPMVPWPKPADDADTGITSNPVTKADKLVKRA